jgi:hypothetical protein
LGNFIRGGEARTVDSFDRATISQALEPIGQSLPAGLTGNAAVKNAAQTVSNAYDKELGSLTFVGDQQFATELTTRLKPLADKMTPEQGQQLQNIIGSSLLARLGFGGRMDGEAFKQVDAELRNLANSYGRSDNPAFQQLGHSLYEARDVMRDALSRHDPAAAARLRDIDASYAMLVRVEDAAKRRLGSEGKFTPTDLLSAARNDDNTVRHRSFSHGDALMQEWANDANKVLRNALPDSGTTERREMIKPGALLMGATHAPVFPAYTQWGMNFLNRYFNPGSRRSAIGDALGTAGSVTAPSTAILGETPR